MSERLLAPVLSDLHLLTVLAETRSYTQAAQRLGISKASASGRVSELERAAGVPLVRRTSRSVALTDAGQRLVDDIAPAFASIESGFIRTRDVVGQPRGLVRVTAPVALGRQRVMPLLPEFLRLYPDIKLELELTDRLVNLQHEGFDLAIRHTDSPPETYVAWELCQSRSWLVASPEYIALHGRPQRPPDLSMHQCLAYLRGGSVQRWSFEKSGRRTTESVSVMVSGPFKANNSELLRDAVLAGLGIGLLPDFSCGDHLREGRMVQVLEHWRPVGFFGQRIFALRPAHLGRTPKAVQCFVDMLRVAFRQ